MIGTKQLFDPRENKIKPWFVASNFGDALGGHYVGLLFQLLAVNQLGFNGSQLALLNVSSMLIFLALNVVAGDLVDRLPVGRVIVAMLVIKAALLSAFCGIYLTWGLTFWSVLLFEILTAFVGLFLDNSQLVGATVLQNRCRRHNVVSLISSGDQIARLISPLAIIPVAHFGQYGRGFVAGAVLAGFAALFALPAVAIRIERKPDDDKDASTRPSKIPGWKSFVGQLLQGLSIIRSQALLAFAVTLMVAANAGLALGDLATTLLVLRVKALSESFYSFTQFWDAAFGIAAAALTPVMMRRFSFPRIAFVATLLQCLAAAANLGLLFSDVAPQAWVLVAGAAWSLGIVMVNIAAMDAASKSIPEDKAGVTFATLRTLSMAVVPLGVFASGWLIDHWGMQVPLALWVAGSLGVVALAAAQLRRSPTS